MIAQRIRIQGDNHYTSQPSDMALVNLQVAALASIVIIKIRHANDGI